MSLPDPILGDTVMHCAVKQRRYPELLEMLHHGGNPFVKNKEGESVASIFQKYSNDEDITVIENSQNDDFVEVIHVMESSMNSTFCGV